VTMPMRQQTPMETPQGRHAGGPLLTSNNPAMCRALQLAAGVARTPASILLTGESGTGKEVMARFIHMSSPRAERPFVAVNCGAIPENLIESELFGHERGAFSGATERRIGRFESAHTGTLLLDEISEMPLALQTRLLRVLQEREIHRVGGVSPISVDVRIIATSNRDLRKMVDAGTFREDLYYRLNVFPLHLPPLNQRKEDLAGLSASILDELAKRFDRSAPRISESAMARLMSWTWPGNVRELHNVLERSLILDPADVIDAQHILLDGDMGRPMPASTMVTPMLTPAASLAEMEQDTILSVLEACGGNRTHTASQLGISIRTLRNRLRDYRARGVVVPEPTRGTASSAGLRALATQGAK